MNTTTHPETMALAATTPAPRALAPGMTSAAALMLDDRSMDRMIRVAELMASGKSTIPAHLRGSPGDCMAVVMQATQWGMNPFAVAQKTHLVNGTLGYEAQLVAAAINNSRLMQSRFNFEWFGPWEKIVGKFKEVESKTKKDDDGYPKKFIVPDWKQTDEQGLGVKVWATVKGETEPRVLELLMTQARTRNSPLWAEDPKQQLAYLAQKRWARLHAPDVILGVYSPDELDAGPAIVHMGDAEVVGRTPSTGPAQTDQTDPLVEAAYAAAKKGRAEWAAFFNKTPKDDRPKLRPYRTELDELAAKVDAERTVDATPAAGAPAQAPTATKTYEDVLAMLCNAKSEDALYVAADWIEAITDSAQVDLLRAKFDELLANLKGGK